MQYQVDKETDRYLRISMTNAQYTGGSEPTTEAGQRPTNCTGFIVFEKYGQDWNLELMNVAPERKGYGSKLLNHSLDYLKTHYNVDKLTVCPTSDASRSFFHKHVLI